MIEAFEEIQRFYEDDLLPPEARQIVKQMLDEFTKSKPN
jgi:hypothetical protein